MATKSANSSLHGSTLISSAVLPSFLVQAKNYALQKIWVPNVLYALIPAIYLLAGTAALFSALFMPGWKWLVPYALLFGGVCIHAGIMVTVTRMRNRK